MHRRHKAQHNPQGFTLLELMMVVIIIAILASIALPQYIRLTEKARASEAINVLGAIRASEMRYKSQSPTFVYTSNTADLDYKGDVVGTAFSTRWNGPTIDITSVNKISFQRIGGAFTGANEVGIELNSGNLCGNFTALGTSNCVSN